MVNGSTAPLRRIPLRGPHLKGYEGDTVTTALWGADVRVLGRSFKYHRPRGVLSLANHDTNAIHQWATCPTCAPT